MLLRYLSPILAVASTCGALFLLVTSNGCLEPLGDGGTTSGGGVATDAGEGGSSTPALTWGCADNGTTCYCYSPAPAEYTQTTCVQYTCCWSDQSATGSGGVQHACQCSNDSACAAPSTSAVRVATCPQ